MLLPLIMTALLRDPDTTSPSSVPLRCRCNLTSPITSSPPSGLGEPSRLAGLIDKRAGSEELGHRKKSPEEQARQTGWEQHVREPQARRVLFSLRRILNRMREGQVSHSGTNTITKEKMTFDCSRSWGPTMRRNVGSRREDSWKRKLPPDGRCIQPCTALRVTYA